MSEGRSASHPERTISVELRQGAHARADRGTGAAGCASGVIVDRTRPRDVLGFSVVAEGKFVSYLRVSTDKQGKSGLGIEAQRQAVERYLNGGRWTVAAEYVETESSRRSDRPKLAAALAQRQGHQGQAGICETTGSSHDSSAGAKQAPLQSYLPKPKTDQITRVAVTP